MMTFAACQRIGSYRSYNKNPSTSSLQFSVSFINCIPLCFLQLSLSLSLCFLQLLPSLPRGHFVRRRLDTLTLATTFALAGAALRLAGALASALHYLLSLSQPHSAKMSFLAFFLWFSFFFFSFSMGVSWVLDPDIEALQEADRVFALPGQPPANFRHYAGYVTVDESHGKALFYWFFEAAHQPAEKPVVLWLNGGPGCSSIAFGATQEIGPFLLRSNGTQLSRNKFSWNKVANMLFLESPVGVGFSYTNTSTDLYNMGDQITATDSHAFLIGWFKRFPNFKSHDFYIVGESYGGHYVPQLAELIHERNKGASKDSSINLKGFMMGNAVINTVTDVSGFVDYLWTHAIISDQLYHEINMHCDFRSVNQTSQCFDHFQSIMKAVSEIDIFNIYNPVCLNHLTNARPKLLAAPRILTRDDLWHKLPSGYDPCTEGYVQTYFNREDVQWALHANVTKLSYPYTTCSYIIKLWYDSPETMLPTIQKLLNVGLRIWVYSGDTDGRVPVTSTRYSINKMRLKVKEEWRAWFHKRQVAGWVETYEGGLTLATVRGAGHQVPVSAPDQSLSLFTHFLSAKTLPSSRF